MAALALGCYDAALNLKRAIHSLPEAYPARSPAYRYPASGGGEAGIEESVLPRVRAVTAEAPAVWLITRMEHLFDPQRIVRHALAEQFPCVASRRYDLIAVTRFDRVDQSGNCPQRSARHGS